MSGGPNSHIHPTVVVGDDVRIGSRVSIGPYAVLTGPLEIGDDCWIGPHCTLGQPPEWIGKVHPPTWTEASPHQGVVVGAGSVLREHTTVHQGGERPTVIGPGAFIMNGTSVGHDVQTGPGCTVAPSTTFGGHVTLGEGVTLGINTVIHQRRVIGSRAMIGMNSVVTKDVPPFAKAYGNPADVHGLNRVGMERAGIPADDIALAERFYAGDGTLPPSLAEEFDWWQSRATKPLLA
ncbi:acyl-ACP--UDP-N- acetylglucosamine O-acyltransferase [Rhodococcus sp. HNM0569]|uniref:acyl-ACP--UDP-N- acetylglucosamine O-acyltransferase n=1 Tax=Rhodococcus sp. HNM0569 TaxID=2716340 RepID=UPI00146D5E58|nr:acyl-ACP--UDP-N- acetylglucosamine O-acyltransferase [Rhodococcus sp. HNM0569]NLU83578.1 acyl-ACP--UDP-N- acetylglucosamine O-acyltransferase [Rhodococcus sp. HNM0569]